MQNNHRPLSRFNATERMIDGLHGRYSKLPHREAKLIRLVRHVYHEGEDQLNALLRQYGLCYSEYGILMMLYGNLGEGINPSELSAASGEKGANLTRICNRLVDRGLINREPSQEDRRRVLLTLSRDGEALIKTLLPPVSDKLASQLDGFDSKELDLLERLLKRMLGNIDPDRVQLAAVQTG